MAARYFKLSSGGSAWKVAISFDLGSLACWKSSVSQLDRQFHLSHTLTSMRREGLGRGSSQTSSTSMSVSLRLRHTEGSLDGIAIAPA